MQQNDEYELFLTSRIEQLENNPKVLTSEINYRHIVGIQNDYRDLRVMLKYIKSNKFCNISQCPEQRAKHHIRTAVFPVEYALNSSIITVNKTYGESVKRQCIQEGLTVLVIQNKHMNTLMTYKEAGESNKIKQFFNEYDIYICHPLRANICLQILNNKQTLIAYNQEQIAISELITTLQQVNAQTVDKEQLYQQIQNISKQLTYHLNQPPNMNGFMSFKETSGVYMYKYQGFYFQRALRFDRISSDFNKIIPSKCLWLFHQDVVKCSQIKALADVQKRTNQYYDYMMSQLNSQIIIDTCLIQIASLLRSKLKTQIILQDEKGVPSLYKHHFRNICSQMPNLSLNEKHLLQVRQIVDLMPFKQYSINDQQSINRAVRIFEQYNNSNMVHKKLDIYKNVENVIEIVKQKLKEDCIICWQQNDEVFLFGCCGISITIPCMIKLFNSRCIKCPNCRFVISNHNHQLGAFLLDQNYKQPDSTYVSKPEELRTSILINNGIMIQFPVFNEQDSEADLVIYSDSQCQSIQWQTYIYNAINNIPSNIKFRIHLISSTQQSVSQYINVFNIQM